MDTKVENKTKGETSRSLCVGCNRSTNHVVLASLNRSGDDEENGFGWIDHFEIISCLGCESTSFRHRSWFSEDAIGDSTGWSERIYPKRATSSLKNKDFWNVPNTLRRIYRESIEAFNNECYTLCAAGLRAIVEGICKEQAVVDGPVTVTDAGGGTRVVRRSNLEGKIAGLCEKGVLTKTSADTLHAHRYLGNDAVHELVQPSVDELRLAFDIVEHTLEQLYEIPEKARGLKDARSRRAP